MGAKIKRYEIIQDNSQGRFRVIDKLKDDYVLIPLVSISREELIDLMGDAINEEVDSVRVHPGYLKTDRDERREPGEG